MRGRTLLGFVFAMLVVCLMCLPFIVSREQAPAEPVERTAVTPAETAICQPWTQTAPEPPAQREDRVTPVPDLAAGVTAPMADANGMPILRISYVRSNYQAFRLTGCG